MSHLFGHPQEIIICITTLNFLQIPHKKRVYSSYYIVKKIPSWHKGFISLAVFNPVEQQVTQSMLSLS